MPLFDDDDHDADALCFTCPKGFNNKSMLAFVADRRVRNAGIKDYDCIMIYEEESDSVSLRYPQNGMDLSVVAKNNRLAKDSTGGGHPFAAGFPVDKDAFEDLLKHKKCRSI
jgi:nanoRNase/pAp phosphatase (c-di-AMP/oligoRNAs hydrolase)